MLSDDNDRTESNTRVYPRLNNHVNLLTLTQHDHPDHAVDSSVGIAFCQYVDGHQERTTLFSGLPDGSGAQSPTL